MPLSKYRCPNPNKMRNWKHADPCKGELYLDKYGMINCKKCDSEHHIFDSKFKCGDETNYGETNMTKIYAAISAVGQMDNGDPEMSQFLEDLLDELNDERKRRRNKK